MRALREHQLVDFLAGLGGSPSEIARVSGIPRSTVRDWLRRPPLVEDASYTKRRPDVPPAEYAYLLGMYLGDGHIARHPRCHRLRITTDAAYPGVIAECAAAIQAVAPRNRVSIRRRTDGSDCVDISAYSKEWLTLFPQHGPGKKHERRIDLAPWQEAIVACEPERFLRGLLHSDGCRVLNPVNGRVYPRYFFRQLSADIREIFRATCRQLGVTVTGAGPTQLSISRRADVALLDSFVGPKA